MSTDAVDRQLKALLDDIERRAPVLDDYCDLLELAEAAGDALAEATTRALTRVERRVLLDAALAPGVAPLRRRIDGHAHTVLHGDPWDIEAATESLADDLEVLDRWRLRATGLRRMNHDALAEEVERAIEAFVASLLEQPELLEHLADVKPTLEGREARLPEGSVWMHVPDAPAVEPQGPLEALGAIPVAAVVTDEDLDAVVSGTADGWTEAMVAWAASNDADVRARLDEARADWDAFRAACDAQETGGMDRVAIVPARVVTAAERAGVAQASDRPDVDLPSASHIQHVFPEGELLFLLRYKQGWLVLVQTTAGTTQGEDGVVFEGDALREHWWAKAEGVHAATAGEGTLVVRIGPYAATLPLPRP